MKRIKYLAIFLASVLSLNVFSQTDYVILWDVTWSMKGMVGANLQTNEPIISSEKVIWDDTKLLLKDVISKIPLDGKSNVKIIPFQDPDKKQFSVEYRSTLNQSEQQELIDFVDKFDIDYPGNGTNICKAIDDVFDNISDKSNTTILIFSDGEQSPGTSYPNDCLDDIKEKFCSWCNIKEGVMYIYELKELNPETGRLDDPCSCIKTTYPTDCQMTIFTTLNPVNSTQSLSYDNASDLLVSFDNYSQLPPSDFKIKVTSSNSRIGVSSNDITYSNGSISIPIEFLNIERGGTESTILSFQGITNDNCYSFNISPVNLSIIREELSKVKIKNIIVR